VKAVILAGGLGTRLSEETTFKPKPMLEIGGMPILWHIMKIYASYGIGDFIVCCGYKGYLIKEYFANYRLHNSDVTFDLKNNQVEVHQHQVEPWRITLVDTGEATQTGGRLKRVASYLQNESSFCLTYGDGVADINIAELIKFHNQHGMSATVTAVRPPGRFGAMRLNGDRVTEFSEKPDGDGGLINGGFFVLSSACLELIDGDSTEWERGVMPKLLEHDQLMAFKHLGFWQPMDTLRDKNYLEELWKSGSAPWKTW